MRDAIWLSGSRRFARRASASRAAVTTADDHPGCADTAVISYGFWQRQFGGQESAIGSRLELGERPLP